MRYLSITLLFTLFYSCAPQLHFLGDTYPQTSHVDTYYSQDDISQKYKVIGQLTGTNDQTGFLKSLDGIKKNMLEEAKKRGANGILFLFSDSQGYQHVVKADLIRYID